MCHTNFFNLFYYLELLVDLAIEDIEQTQSHDMILETYRGSSLRSMSPLENQAHSVLTP